MSIIYVYGNQPSGDRCREFHQSPLKIVDADIQTGICFFIWVKAWEDHLLGLFLCIWTKEFVYGHTRNLIRGMIKTILFLHKNEIYVFCGGCRRRALNKHRAFRAIWFAWKTGAKLIWLVPRSIGNIRPEKPQALWKTFIITSLLLLWSRWHHLLGPSTRHPQLVSTDNPWRLRLRSQISLAEPRLRSKTSLTRVCYLNDLQALWEMN